MASSPGRRFSGRRGRFRAAPRGLGKTRREPSGDHRPRVAFPVVGSGRDLERGHRLLRVAPFSGVQNAEGEAAGPRNAARSWTLLQSSSLPLRASSLNGSQNPMPIYPSDFWKRSEQKWKRRGEESGSTLRTPQTGKNRSGLAPQQDGDTILSRWPWLISIGRGLHSEYAAFKQPVEKRLVALLKKLRRSRAR